MTPTEERLVEIKALETTATPGPWELRERFPDFFGISKDTSYPWVQALGASFEESEANAALIVAMRNYLPWMLEQVDNLKEQNQSLSIYNSTLKVGHQQFAHQVKELQERVRELEDVK